MVRNGSIWQVYWSGSGFPCSLILQRTPIPRIRTDHYTLYLRSLGARGFDTNGIGPIIRRQLCLQSTGAAQSLAGPFI